MKLQKKQSLAQKRRWRIRKKVKGTAERPRLTVHFSNKHIYAQCIDDVKGHTLAYVTSVGGDLQQSRQTARVLSHLVKRSPRRQSLQVSKALFSIVPVVATTVVSNHSQKPPAKVVSSSNNK